MTTACFKQKSATLPNLPFLLSWPISRNHFRMHSHIYMCWLSTQKCTKVGELFLGFCLCGSILIFAKIWNIQYVWLMQDLSVSVVCEYLCLSQGASTVCANNHFWSIERPLYGYPFYKSRKWMGVVRKYSFYVHSVTCTGVLSNSHTITVLALWLLH